MAKAVHPIVGVWSLLSFTEHDTTTRKTSYPMGEHPKAMVIYTNDGHVAAIFTATGRCS